MKWFTDIANTCISFTNAGNSAIYFILWNLLRRQYTLRFFFVFVLNSSIDYFEIRVLCSLWLGHSGGSKIIFRINYIDFEIMWLRGYALSAHSLMLMGHAKYLDLDYAVFFRSTYPSRPRNRVRSIARLTHRIWSPVIPRVPYRRPLLRGLSCPVSASAANFEATRSGTISRSTARNNQDHEWRYRDYCRARGASWESNN